MSRPQLGNEETELWRLSDIWKTIVYDQTVCLNLEPRLYGCKVKVTGKNQFENAQQSN